MSKYDTIDLQKKYRITDSENPNAKLSKPMALVAVVAKEGPGVIGILRCEKGKDSVNLANYFGGIVGLLVVYNSFIDKIELDNENKNKEELDLLKSMHKAFRDAEESIRQLDNFNKKSYEKRKQF